MFLSRRCRNQKSTKVACSIIMLLTNEVILEINPCWPLGASLWVPEGLQADPTKRTTGSANILNIHPDQTLKFDQRGYICSFSLWNKNSHNKLSSAAAADQLCSPAVFSLLRTCSLQLWGCLRKETEQEVSEKKWAVLIFYGTPKIIALKAKIRVFYNDHFMVGFSAHLASKTSIFSSNNRLQGLHKDKKRY